MSIRSWLGRVLRQSLRAGGQDRARPVASGGPRQTRPASEAPSATLGERNGTEGPAELAARVEAIRTRLACSGDVACHSFAAGPGIA
ncbi:hypothetical protein J31TS4_37720 [Paenibacillus sp. J31TS4]|uniref:hypothetical protein n=1 Tax=Paenibacillus sp. J31TS4 TaxID=2807195 RepID=UPI001AFFE750|nr:hypothetical protein [Paenibacillus sp. J31TS4]GIP40492.1 hypothetical protein J31TS4_37720 [Paenibacillus sp. J31TS4]